MKSKTSLQLMELLIMILVFALSAAICLQIFAKAKDISNSAARLDKAVALAQNAAEVLKLTAGDTESAQTIAVPPYRLECLPRNNSAPGLQEVQIQVYAEDVLLYSLNTGWQEGMIS